MYGEAPPVTEIFLIFLKLGLSSFGGSIAISGISGKSSSGSGNGWTNMPTRTSCRYANLPGPASSQVGMALVFRVVKFPARSQHGSVSLCLRPSCLSPSPSDCPSSGARWEAAGFTDTQNRLRGRDRSGDLGHGGTTRIRQAACHRRCTFSRNSTAFPFLLGPDARHLGGRHPRPCLPWKSDSASQ